MKKLLLLIGLALLTSNMIFASVITFPSSSSYFTENGDSFSITEGEGYIWNSDYHSSPYCVGNNSTDGRIFIRLDSDGTFKLNHFWMKGFSTGTVTVKGYKPGDGSTPSYTINKPVYTIYTQYVTGFSTWTGLEKIEISNGGQTMFVVDDIDYDKELSVSGGTGTSGDPYQIATLTDLQVLSDNPTYWDKYYIQTANINASATSGWNSGAGFSPIGNLTTSFTGSYDGQDYTISNLYISRASTGYVGLFGYIGDGATVANLAVTNANVTGQDRTGILIGYANQNINISKCSTSGTVTGRSVTGGFIGQIYNGTTIDLCYTSATVTGTQTIGGFIGYIYHEVVSDDDKPTITNSYATGDVTGTLRNNGGFVGLSYGIIKRCYASGNVTGNQTNGESRIGGFVGGLADFSSLDKTGKIYDSYSTGNIICNGTNTTSTHGIGGFAGAIYYNGVIENCYSTGSVPSTGTNYSGFCGWVPADYTCTNNFWDTQTSGQTATDPCGATGKSTAELKKYITFTNTAITGLESAWDFVGNPCDDASDNDYWDMDQLETVNSGYPILSWQQGADNTLITYSGGDGSSGTPYQIANSSDLIDLSNIPGDWDKYYVQTANITFNSDETLVDWDGSGSADGSGTSGLSPIGNSTTVFTGFYDGQNHNIDNLYIYRPASLDIALFGSVASPANDNTLTIRNLGITNADITGARYTGSLVGQLNYAKISNCYATGNVKAIGDGTGYSQAGGLVGRTWASIIEECYSTADVDANGFRNGGLVGQMWESGGYPCQINQSYATGYVKGGTSYGGGLIGIMNGGSIQNCYATGDVHRESGTNTTFAGLIGGYYDTKPLVKYCYCSGSVNYDDATNPTDKGFSGAVAELATGTTGNFFNSTLSNQTSSNTSTEKDATPKTSSEMQTQSTFTDAGWDFFGESTNGTDDYWVLNVHNDGFPWLRYMGASFTTATWIGDISSDWNTSGNWSSTNTPHADIDVTIPSARSNNPEISSSLQVTCNDLTIESGGSLTVKSDGTGTGSLIINGTSSGNLTVERYITGNQWHYITAPVAGQEINETWLTNNSIVSSPNYQFFRYAENHAYWIIYSSTGNPEAFGDETFGAAKGYTVTRSGDGDLTFTGTIQTSAVNYAAGYTANKGKGNNLVGNPFPSTIAITEDAQNGDNFLADNADILDDSYQGIYIWDEGDDYSYGDNDYKVVCNAGFTGQGSGSLLTEDFVQPGQAFMVKVKQAGNLVFNPDIRVHGSADYYKSKSTWPGVELKINGNENSNSTIIAFNQNMNPGLDPSYDVVKIKGNPDLALYTVLVEDNGNDYAVQSLPLWNIEESPVAVGVDVSQAGVYEFSIYEEMLDDFEILLEDRESGSMTNLRNGNYFADISQSGTGRFYLHFKNLTGIAESYPQNKIQFGYSFGQLCIQNPDHEKGLCKVINIAGQVLEQHNISGNLTQKINISQPTGIYIVRIQTNKSATSRKVFIY